MKKIYFLLPIILIIGNVLLVSTSRTFMHYEFEKNNVYLKFENADEIHSEVIKFFFGKKMLDVKEFNEREISHMHDVKVRFWWAFVILIILVAIALHNVHKWKDKLIRYVHTSFIFMIIFSLVVIGKFAIFFTFFHKILFSAGTWLFDPANEAIVNIYPQQVFLDIGILSIALVFIELSVLFLFSVLFIKDKAIPILNFHRPIHVAVGMLGVLLGGVFEFEIITAMFSIGLFIMANFIFNDIKDIEVDRLNKKNRVLVKNTISINEARRFFYTYITGSFLLALFINWKFLIMLAAAEVISYHYSSNKKNIFSAFASAILFASVVIFGAVATLYRPEVWLYFIFGFIFIFCRELIKDIDDFKGDKKNKNITIPIKYGIKTTYNIIRVISVIGLLVSFKTVIMWLLIVAHVLLFASTFIKRFSKHIIYYTLVTLMIIALWI